MSSPASEQKSSASTSSAKSASPVAEHDDGHRRTPSASSGTQRLSTHSVADVEAPALEAASSVPATAPRCESGVAVAATNWREGMDRADGPPAVLSSVRGSIMATAISHAPLLRYGRPQPPSPYSSRAPSLPSAPSWAPLSSGLRRHGTRQPISPSPPRDYSSLSPTPVKMAPEPYNPANLRPASLFGGISPEAARPTYSYNRASTEAYVAAPTSVERPCEDSAQTPAVGVSSVLDPSVEPQGLLRPPTPSYLGTAVTGTQHAESKPAMAPLAGPPSPAETPLRLIDSNAAQSTPSHAKSHKDVVASPSAKAPNSAVVLAQLQAQLRAPLTIGGAAPLTTLDLSHVRLPEKEWSWLCQHILPRLTSLDVLRLCDVGLTDAMLGELIKYQSAFSSRTRREAARPRTAPAASSSSILQSTSATRDDECERRPPWRVVDVSSNHLTHRGATFLGRLLLRHAATLEELHARCNPFRDYGLQVLGVYLGKCSAESLKDEPYLFSAELRLAYRDITTSCHAKEGEEDTQPVSRLAELLKKLHVGPSLLDLRECRASARGVSELLHGASKSHCLRTVLLTHNVPSPRGLLPSPSAEDGASSLNHCIITSGKLMEQPTFSQFLPLHHPAALRDVSLGGVPLSQLCSPAGCRSVLLGLLFCCPDLCVLDLSGTFTTELLPRPQLLDLLAEGTMEEQILQGAPPSPTSFDSWCQIVLAAERADEMPIVLDQLSVAGQSRVGDVLCELLSHAAFNAATTKKVVPSAFGHIKELHLASTGITDVAVRGLCRAVRNTTASWGLLQDLAVLNLADNLLTTLGCVEVIRCFIMDWPVASSGSCLEDLSVQGNAGVAEHDGQAMSVLGQSAHCAVSYRAADPCCTDSCGATGVRPLAIHYGLAGAQSPTHTVSCGRDGVVGSTVASSKAAGWADGIGLRTPHALHEVSSILEVSGRKAQELSSIADATGTMYPARRSLLRELEEQADEGETLVGSASHNVAEPTEVVELRPQRLVSPPSQMNDVESSTPAANFEVEIDEPNEQDAAQPPLVGQEEPTNTEQEHHTDTLPSPDHVQKRSASRETCSTVASRASSANRRTLSTEVLEGEAQQVPIGADVPKEVADLVALADDAMPQDGPCLDKDEEAPPMPSSPSPTTAAEVDEGANGGDAETATTMFPELSPPSTVPSPVGVGFSASPLPPGEAPSDPTSPPTPAERSMEVVVNPRPELAVVAPKSPTTVQQAVPMEVSTSPVLPSTADAGASPIEVTPKTSKPASPKQDAAEKLRKEQEAYERAAQQLRRQMMQNAYEGLLQKPQTSPDESSDHLLVAKGKWKGQQRVVLTIHQTTSLLMLSYEKKKLVGKNKQAVMLVHPLALGVRCGTSTEKSSKKEPQLLIHLTRPFLPEEVGVARAKVVAKVGEGAKDAGSSEGKALSAELLPREVDINITLSSLADLQAALATLKKEVSRAVEIFQTALPSPPAPRSATTSTPNPGATPSTAQSQSRAPQRRAPAAPSAATRKPS